MITWRLRPLKTILCALGRGEFALELFIHFLHWIYIESSSLTASYYRVTNNAQTLEKALFSKLNLTKT